MSEQTIPCPVCAEQGIDSKIHFETSRLLEGDRFACPVCQTEIGLAAESKPQVEKALAALAIDSTEQRLTKLDDLKSKGLITDEEYQNRRSAILDEIL